MHNQSIVVLVDSQAAIKAPTKCTVTSITVFNCIRSLNQLDKQIFEGLKLRGQNQGLYLQGLQNVSLRTYGVGIEGLWRFWGMMMEEGWMILRYLTPMSSLLTCTPMLFL